ncbi:Gfo/Idh/MocA family oxidoreductase [Rathayibacter oskolensis]|nr:Gfo/Idh/MocA family oxidoreductase [Rathayibacter oskolensis]WKK70698.1 Gfo/Idh/MocA family oxidoreductase [Rathayibacter oskolensis]
MALTLPEPRLPSLLDSPVLKWGVVAPGGIAGSFVEALQKHTRQRVVAVGSRSLERAERFARRFGIERASAGYDAVVNDPEVDVVYIASPHPSTPARPCSPSRRASTSWSRSRSRPRPARRR